MFRCLSFERVRSRMLCWGGQMNSGCRTAEELMQAGLDADPVGGAGVKNFIGAVLQQRDFERMKGMMVQRGAK